MISLFTAWSVKVWLQNREVVCLNIYHLLCPQKVCFKRYRYVAVPISIKTSSQRCRLHAHCTVLLQIFVDTFAHVLLYCNTKLRLRKQDRCQNSMRFPLFLSNFLIKLFLSNFKLIKIWLFSGGKLGLTAGNCQKS